MHLARSRFGNHLLGVLSDDPELDKQAMPEGIRNQFPLTKAASERNIGGGAPCCGAGGDLRPGLFSSFPRVSCALHESERSAI